MRTVLFSVLTVVIVALVAACSNTPTTPTPHTSPALSRSVPIPKRPVDSIGAIGYLCGSCITSDGRSGYLIASGDKCQAC